MGKIPKAATGNDSGLNCEARLWAAAGQAMPATNCEESKYQQVETARGNVAPASSPASPGGVPAARRNTGRGRPVNPPTRTSALPPCADDSPQSKVFVPIPTGPQKHDAAGNLGRARHDEAGRDEINATTAGRRFGAARQHAKNGALHPEMNCVYELPDQTRDGMGNEVAERNQPTSTTNLLN